MIELNLLPDVKLEYVKAQRSRRLIVSIAVLVSGAAIVLLFLLLSVSGLQKKHLNDLSKDIARQSSELQQKPDINRILTVQNQLTSITNLHNSKPAVSRLSEYLNELTPAQVSISSFSADFAANTMSITGTADSLSSVNKYVDTLKFTTYKVKGSDTSTKAFSNIVLGSFGLSGQSGPNAASYMITLVYDKNIFDTTQSVTLSVPNLVTTRFKVGQPTDLFQAQPATANSSKQEGSH